MNWKVKILLGVVVLALVWMVGKSSYRLFQYWRLSEEAPAVIEAMEVERLSSAKFGYSAIYHFAVKGKVYKAKGVLAYPVYPNQYAAEAEIEKWRTFPWTAYYAPSNPAISSLERPFPWKSALYALIVVGIFLYFLYFFSRYRIQ